MVLSFSPQSYEKISMCKRDSLFYFGNGGNKANDAIS